MAVFEYLRRVRYVDTDQYQAAHHSRVYLWFEEARLEYLRALGRPYQEFETAGLFFPVYEAGCRYRGPARFDDLLTVTVERVAIGGATLRFEYQVRCDAREVAEGFTLHACVDREARVRRIPRDVKELLQPPS